MSGWLADEITSCSLSDQRLTKRLINLLESISENPELSINAAYGSFAASKAAYRFLQNPNVTPAGILKQTTFNYDQIKSKRCQTETCVRGINKTIPIGEKASYRWIEHLKESIQPCSDFKS